MLRKWDSLPDFMRNDEVRPYYEILKKKQASLFFKRVFDIVCGLIILIITAIPMMFIAVIKAGLKRTCILQTGESHYIWQAL